MIEPDAERGSVSVVAAGAICVALICTMGVADVGRVLAERSHAEAAADAAALAAAQDLALSSGDPEVDADRFAEANGAFLVDCACAAGDADAEVTVRRTIAGLLLVPGPVSIDARARATVDLP
jgi:secretion/DNA translocation related TadE-like protein